MKKKEGQRENNLDIVLMAAYFMLPFIGLRIALENYLMDDTLDIVYVMLLGLVGGVISTIYLTLLRTKTLRVKIFVLGIILITIIAINLMVI